jgi:hypothetical protein
MKEKAAPLFETMEEIQGTVEELNYYYDILGDFSNI